MKDFLSSIALFKGLEDSLFDELMKQVTEESFPKDQILFRSGENADKLFIVTKGSIKLYNSRPGSNKEETVCIIQQGSFFCLAPLINGEKFISNAKALEDSSALEVSSGLIHGLIEKSHPFAKNVIRYLSKKECELCEEVCNLSLSTTKERLAKYLLEQSHSEDISQAFPLGMNQTELASFLGTVREIVSRDLSDFRKAGIITIKEKMVRIENEEELNKLLSYKEEKPLNIL